MVVIAPDNFPGPIKRRANVFHVREKLEASRARVALILCASLPLFVPFPNDIIPIDHFRIRRRRRRRRRPRYSFLESIASTSMNSRPPPTRPRKRLDAAAGPLVENFSLTAFLSFTWRLRLIRIPSPLPLPFPTSFYLPICLATSPLPHPSLFHRSTPSSFSLSRSSRSYVYEWDSFEPRFTDSRAHAHAHTRARTHGSHASRRARIARVRSLVASRPSNAVFRCPCALRTQASTYVRVYTDDDHLRAHSNLLLP